MIEIIITSSVLIVLLCILRYVLKGRISSCLQYALWGLVVLRLVIPGSFAVQNLNYPASLFSVTNAIEKADEKLINNENLMINSSIPDGTAAPDETCLIKEEQAINWNRLITAAWGIGTACILIWMLFVNVSFHRYLYKRRTLLPAEGYAVPVYAVAELGSPCLFGLFFKQAVYITPEAAKDPECLRHVLEHEYCHIRHLDYVWSLVRCLLTAVYWFNPFVWIAAHLSKKDCELACDESVIRRLGESERIHYGKTLLALLSDRQCPAKSASLATSMTSDEKWIRERIKMLARKPKIYGIVSFTAVLTAAVFAAFTFTSAAKEPAKMLIGNSGYTNIALFGVEVPNGEAAENARSNAILILSMNQDTGAFKLLSVYRDTYFNIGGDLFGKAGEAFSAGGPQQAVNMLNRNMDMNITDYITFGYQNMTDIIDSLGGIMIDVEKEEVDHLNNYQITMANEQNRPYTAIIEPGNQLLNGMQATAYCRIRYTKGDDFRRAERQSKVLQKMAEKAAGADSKVFYEIAENIVPNISTSLGLAELKNILYAVGKNGITETAGFPTEENRIAVSIGAKGSFVVPGSLEDNVVWLHSFLYGEKQYTVSEQVKQYSKIINDWAAKYSNDKNG